jgi:hypothetical protein
MTGPRRIRLSRAKGSRKPPSAVVVTRSTPWGNPFVLATADEHPTAADELAARRLAVDEHRDWLDGKGDQDVHMVGRRVLDRRWVLANLHLLAGRDLVCGCPLPDPGQPDVCHGATLLELANGGAS